MSRSKLPFSPRSRAPSALPGDCKAGVLPRKHRERIKANRATRRPEVAETIVSSLRGTGGKPEASGLSSSNLRVPLGQSACQIEFATSNSLAGFEIPCFVRQVGESFERGNEGKAITFICLVSCRFQRYPGFSPLIDKTDFHNCTSTSSRTNLEIGRHLSIPGARMGQ